MSVGAIEPATTVWREFGRWRHGVEYALDGGLWLHRHLWRGHAMAHLVSADRMQLERAGMLIGLHPSRLQFRPLRDPRSGMRRAAWHWDLVGPWIAGLPRVR